ncbi:MAG: Beta-galactosidase/beta-glucuronidase [Parcubacteria group bacterium GW2011_GWA2_43_17]|jgi:beta-mannosidase|nr:MAG: Beta-galactosidase/beta-glucuronidase [Parcubacteria group bacterium GW2011_GWA2_43_17]OHB44371.1 MAG: hypothetical protein A2Y13_08165 [Planctomycetes bacterium GWC2_45_44]
MAKELDNMNADIIDISEGWDLGWCKETKLNKWIQVFGFWKIEKGRLVGEGCSPHIFANIEPENNYVWESIVCIDAMQGELSVVVKRSLERFAYYDICFKPGSQIRARYVYSAVPDTILLENVGPVIESGKEYKVQIFVQDGIIKVRVDDEPVGEFKDTFLTGKNPGFHASGNGVAYLRQIKLTDIVTGNVIFEDDLKTNSLIKKVPVDLSELISEEWVSADIPGSVHSSLLKAGKIADPYLGYNGPKQEWIDNQRWIYKSKFKVPVSWRGKNLRLLFEGVDYHGYFWLNGVLLGYHEGMFGGPEYDISSLVDRNRENELVVCLLPSPSPAHSTVKPYILQRWHFNMDILSIGLWRKVKLMAFDNITLDSPQVVTRSISEDKAILNISISVANLAMYPFEVRGEFILQSPCKNVPDIVVEFAPGFFHGSMRVDRTMEVPNPQLWWPNGMGEQNIYKLTIVANIYEPLKGTDPTGHAEMCITTGIRTLEMKPSPNINGKYKWIFCINGRPFFGKGSNWMPVDQMLRLSPEKYDRLLKLARESNINILRPWGAGLLETEEFYDACDRYGICVWQEFPLANGYFREIDKDVWRNTIIRNVVRLRNRPSLVMWCGGNEFDPDHVDNKEIVDDLENLCRELDMTRDFHRACPYGGDSHSYQVNWMANANYTFYTRDLSIAVTEYSMASPPCMDTLKKIIPAEELNKWPPDSPENLSKVEYDKWGTAVCRRESAFSMHDAHLSKIMGAMIPSISDCGIPGNWEEFIRYAQTEHGILTQFGIDFWRSRWPYCTAVMSWVFNVVWPSAMSWEYVDWFGVPKASYYYQKRAFEPIHIGAVFEQLFWCPGSTFRTKLYVANETLTKLKDVSIKVMLYNYSLELLKEQTQKLDIPADDVKHCGFFEYEIPMVSKEQVLFLCVDLLGADGHVLSRSQYTPRVGQPNIQMPYITKGPWISDVKNFPTALESQYDGDWTKLDDGTITRTIAIKNIGDRPAYQVSIGVPDFEEFMRYSDNFFWLEAGEKRVVEIYVLSGKQPEVEISAWNAEKTTVKIISEKAK